MIRESQRQAALPKLDQQKSAEPRDFAEEQGGLY